MRKSLKQQAQQEAIERLREILKPGDTVYTVLRHVSRSGMTRMIDICKLDNAQKPTWLSQDVAKALGWTFDDNHRSIKVSDVGMHPVYTLSHTLFDDGYALEQAPL